MIAVLLPVKRFDRSKQRLAEFLTVAERVELARSMFDDVWAALAEAQRKKAFDRLLVASAEPYVLQRCRDEGIACLEETEQTSHSESVIRATEWAISLGAATLLSVPIDTPAITAAEILSLLELRHRYPVVIVPSSDGTGTNALLRTPPDAMRPHFGSGSCRLHVQAAEANGFAPLVYPSPGLGNDIDTPEDMQSFLAQNLQDGQASRTRELVRRLLALHSGATACP